MTENQKQLTGLTERDEEMMCVKHESEGWVVEHDFEAVVAEAGTPEHDKAVEIKLNGDETSEQIKELIKQELPRYFWWMNPYWKEKGKPTETVEFTTKSGRKVEVINWHRPLSESELLELKEVIDIFSSAYEGRALKSLGYVLIDNKVSNEQLRTGGMRNGYGELTGRRDGNDGIRLYPNALEGEHRAAANMTNFKGTLIHETTHHIALWNTPLMDDWMERFGWNDEREDTVQLRNARCITDYAKWKADEDVCDSMVAKVANNSQLDEEKSAFIQEKVLSNRKEDGIVGLNRLEKGQSEPPRIPERIYFKKAPTIKIRIS